MFKNINRNVCAWQLTHIDFNIHVKALVGHYIFHPDGTHSLITNILWQRSVLNLKPVCSPKYLLKSSVTTEL